MIVYDSINISIDIIVFFRNTLLLILITDVCDVPCAIPARLTLYKQYSIELHLFRSILWWAPSIPLPVTTEKAGTSTAKGSPIPYWRRFLELTSAVLQPCATFAYLATALFATHLRRELCSSRERWATLSFFGNESISNKTICTTAAPAA